MTVRRLATCTVGGWAAACSLVYAGELDEARDPTSVPFDGGTDAATLGTPTRDATDERVDTDGAPAVRGCAGLSPPPKFCRDFDDGRPLEDGPLTIRGDAGDFTFDSLSYSGTRSMRVAIANGGGCTYDELGGRWATTGKLRAEAHVRMRPSSPFSTDQTITPIVLGLTAATGGQSCVPLLYVRGSSSGRVISTAVNMQSATAPTNDIRELDGFPEVNRWTDVAMAFTPSLDGTVLTVAFQAESGVVTRTAHVFPQCPGLGGPLEVRLGLHCEDGNAEVRFDDLRVDWE